MKKIMIAFVLVTLGTVGGTALAETVAHPFSCAYNEYNGVPVQLFQRVETGPDDWYSKYKQIEFCKSTNGSGSYVLIQEELIKGFRVLNLPRAILNVAADSSGTVVSIADDLDHSVLKISPDGQTMEASGTWFSEKISAQLKLVWHQ